MTAQELVDKVVYKGHRPFAQVVVARGRAYSHYKLKPDQEVPEENEDTTVFIHIDDVT